MLGVRREHFAGIANASPLSREKMQLECLQLFFVILRKFVENSLGKTPLTRIGSEPHHRLTFDNKKFGDYLDEFVHSNVVEIVRAIEVAHATAKMSPIEIGAVRRVTRVYVLHAPG